jgi:hypothetical protein
MQRSCWQNAKTTRAMALQYKFVELTTVTDDRIEACVNEWVGKGWRFDGIRFVSNESSRRPVMAFVSFTREIDDAQGTSESAPVVRVSDPVAAMVARSASVDGDDTDDD